MDQDQRDPRASREPERPEDAADDAERPTPPSDEPSREPEAAAPPGDAASEPAAPEPAATEPAAAEMESWPSQDAASSTEPEAAKPDETRPWPTEPPEAAAPDEAGTWPTSAPERGDEEAAEVAAASSDAPAPAWPPEEPAPTTPPAEVEAETDESAWAAAPDAETEPPPSEAEAYPTAAAASVAAAGAAAHGVPDAEAAVGESTQCPRCGTENRPGLAFCRNCGQRLVAAGVATTVERPGTPEGTMACPRCGTHNRNGVAFCQNCGANLRGTAPGYVPPAVEGPAPGERAAVETGGAVLGPVVLLIGLIGLITGYLLPFAYGGDSLYERAFGAGGYGTAFWSAYPADATLADTIYFGLAAPVPILGGLVALLAIAGFVRGRPGGIQVLGLVIALAWSVGLIVLFLIVEVLGNWSGGIVDVLRELNAGGIILFLASLIVLIGTLTRFGRS